MGHPVFPSGRLHAGLHDETGRVAGLKDEFEKRNVKVMGLSVDSLEDHNGWLQDIDDVTGNAVNFPLIADSDRRISYLGQHGAEFRRVAASDRLSPAHG